MSGGVGNDPLDDLFNATAQIFTAGLVGYDKNGFKGGASIGAVKEVTGANAAEEANKLAREQLEQQTAAANQDRQNAIAQNEKNAITASQAAGNATRRNRNTNNRTSRTEIGDVTDFLGI